MSPQSRKRELEDSKAGNDAEDLETSHQTGRNSKKSRKHSSISQAYPKPETKVDEQGVEYWEISKNRRVNVAEFAGQNMINIREFYEKDGKNLPGKKGISLTVPQYAALVLALPDIHRVLEEKGESISKPQFERKYSMDQKEEVKEDICEQAPDKKMAEKRNFDTTSDEDEG